MKPYLDGRLVVGRRSCGTSRTSGYLTAWTGAQLAEGKTFEATNDVSHDLPAVTYDDATKMLLLGPAAGHHQGQRRTTSTTDRPTPAGGGTAPPAGPCPRGPRSPDTMKRSP